MPSISNNFEKKKVLWCCCFQHQLHLTEIWHHTNSAINIKLSRKEIQNIPHTKSNDGKETVESISNHQYKFIKGTHCHRTTSNFKVPLLTLISLHSFHCTFCAQKKKRFTCQEDRLVVYNRIMACFGPFGTKSLDFLLDM